MASQLKHTVMPSGGDFTSLDAAIDHLVASHADLVSADVYADIEIDGTWSSADTTCVSISGITTDATRYLNIYTTATARHSGVWSTSKYSLVSSIENHTILVGDTVQHLRLDGLQISASSYMYRCCVRLSSSTDNSPECRVSNCILKLGGTSATYQSGIAANDGILLKAWNNIIYGFSGTGDISLSCRHDTLDCLIYNNTIIDCTIGIYIGGWADGKIVNNLISGSSTAISGYVKSVLNNALSTSQNLSNNGETVANNRTSQTFTFVDADNDNYHLASNDAGARDYGTSSVDSLFTTDIDGETRSGTWDIGADEYVAAGGSTIWKSQRRKYQHLVVR